ncbi:MAG: flagellar basal body P-ring formation protein FlgA [Magnetococcales bacterium]|nr:flagellar basal body P-ring formation protein FlgA [Magnetococcales bacterium]
MSDVMKPHKFIMLALGLLALVSGGSALAQTVEKELLGNAVGQRLQSVLSARGEAIKVVSVNVRQNLDLPDGPIQLRMQIPAQDQVKIGYQIIPVTILVNGQEERTIRTTAVLKRWIRVPILKKDVSRGEIISSHDLAWKMKLANRPIPGQAESLDELIGQAATRTIRAGQPLMARWFQKPLAVDRGQRVEVMVSKGGMRIKAVGVAAQKGYVGESIRIRNPASNRLYLAKVTGPGSAQVELY